MDARRISFPSNGETTEGFMALPESGRGPGVIVLQEWWGLVPHIEDVCRRFAAEGFIALAPDLYQGRTTRSPDDAGKLMMALNIDRTEHALRGAVKFLKAAPGLTSSGVGVVGFCMGGQLALYAATRNPDIAACANYYGIHPHVQPDFKTMHAAVLGFFGEKDSSVPPATARGLETAIRASGNEVEIHIYPGAKHAFFNDTRPEVHDPGACADTWRRMIPFLRKHLG
jgi:carboxymethylenebutenolidase